MDDAPAREAHHVHADSGLTDERIRVLKHGDTFALFDERGDIRSRQWGESGLYHDGTRFLSRFHLELEGARPFLLSSTVRDDNDQLVVALTNPDLYRQGQIYLPMGSLHLAWRKLLWLGTLYQELRVENHGMAPADFSITMHFAADFADIYEVRGMRRKARGQDLEPDVTDGQVKLRYLGLDGIARRTILSLTPHPDKLTASCASFNVNLAPQETASFYAWPPDANGIPRTSRCYYSTGHELNCALIWMRKWRSMPRSRPRTGSSTRWCGARPPTCIC